MPKTQPVKVELAKRGQTQRSFAPEVGVSAQVLSHVLNGQVAPWAALRNRVAEKLDRPEAELFPEVDGGVAL